MPIIARLSYANSASYVFALCLIAACAATPPAADPLDVSANVPPSYQSKNLVLISAAGSGAKQPIGPGDLVVAISGRYLLPSRKDCGDAVESVIRAFADENGLIILRSERTPGRTLIHMKDERYPRGYVEALYRFSAVRWAATVSFTLVTLRGGSTDPDALYSQVQLRELERRLRDAVACL